MGPLSVGAGESSLQGRQLGREHGCKVDGEGQHWNPWEWSRTHTRTHWDPHYFLASYPFNSNEGVSYKRRWCLLVELGMHLARKWKKLKGGLAEHKEVLAQLLPTTEKSDTMSEPQQHPMPRTDSPSIQQIWLQLFFYLPSLKHVSCGPHSPKTLQGKEFRNA